MPIGGDVHGVVRRAHRRYGEPLRIPPDRWEVREALSCVVRDADRAKDIVGRVPDHVKKAPPRKDRFEVNEAIEEVIVMVRSAIGKNKVSVRTDFMANPIPVRAIVFNCSRSS